MKNILTGILLILIFNKQIQAQCNEASNWYFGANCGISFCNAPGQPSPANIAPSMVNTLEGVATISDENGNLLFYTDGMLVWDASHTLMPGCMFSSPGGQLLGNPSSTQSGVIVPKPLDPNTYYIFAVDEIYGANGMTYSKVDMTANGGFGDVDLGEKNIQLINPCCEKIAVTQHINGIDFWVVGHDWGNDAFVTYLVTPAGVQTLNPVVSNVGNAIIGSFTNKRGYLKFSPGGSKLAQAVVGNSYFELFSFNRTTGVISNQRLINSPWNGAYGVEFSPSEQLLYGACWYSNSDSIYQWDISSNNQQVINNSIQAVGVAVSNWGIGALQLGPDGMIYVAKQTDVTIGRIQYPDLPSTACAYQDVALTLNGSCLLGFPTFISSFFSAEFSFNPSCFGSPWEFFLLDSVNIDSAIWNFSDTLSGVNNVVSGFNVLHDFSSEGAFLVNLTLYVDTVSFDMTEQVTVYDQVELIPFNDTVVCLGDTLELSVNYPFTVIEWSTGESSSSITLAPQDSTMIYVQATIQGCTYSDSVVIIPIELDADFVVDPPNCFGDTIFVEYTGMFPIGYTPEFNWDIGFANFAQGSSSTTGSVYINSYVAGDTILTLEVSYPGCSSSVHQENITFPAEPQLNILSDVPLCFGDANGSLEVSFSGSLDASCIWSTGDTSLVINNLSSGLYNVAIFYDSICKTDTSLMLEQPAPLAANAILTHVLCANDSSGSIEVNPSGGTGDYTYLWSTNDTIASIVNLPTGSYSLTFVDENNCSFVLVDSISEPPVLNIQISEDTVVCSGDTVLLMAVASGGATPYDYIWAGIDTNQWIAFVPSHNTSLVLVAIDANGCQSPEEMVNVFTDPALGINPLTNVPDSICPFDPISVFAEAIGGIGYGYSYFVNDELVTLPYMMQPDSSQLIAVQVMDACQSYSSIAYIPVNVIDAPDNPMGTDSYMGCAPYTVMLDDYNNEIGSEFEWTIEKSDGLYYSYLDYPEVTWNSPGDYSVKLLINNIYGCDFSSVYRSDVHVYPKPSANFISDEISVGMMDPTLFFENISTEMSSATWSFGDGTCLQSTDQYVSHTYPQPNDYRVQLIVTSPEGCIDTSYRDVNVFEIAVFYAPTALNPFSSYGNNLFMPLIAPKPKSIHLWVYDRWGGLIFETFDYDHAWDGKSSGGTLVKQDVYTWMLEYVDNHNVRHTETGVIAIIY